MLNDHIAITGVWLKRVGEHVIVSVEINGRWVEVIREWHDSSFSHIVEPSGLRSRLINSVTKSNT